MHGATRCRRRRIWRGRRVEGMITRPSFALGLTFCIDSTRGRGGARGAYEGLYVLGEVRGPSSWEFSILPRVKTYPPPESKSPIFDGV